MKFIATDNQIKQILANAVNASIPMGLGHMHYQATQYMPEDFELSDKIHLDYIDGRMVKLYIRRCEKEDTWEYSGFEPRGDYQSWARTYPTIKDLLSSVGVEAINDRP